MPKGKTVPGGVVGGLCLGCGGSTVPGMWWEDCTWDVVGALGLGCGERTVPWGGGLGLGGEDCVWDVLSVSATFTSAVSLLCTVELSLILRSSPSRVPVSFGAP